MASSLFVVCDNILKGAALNAVQIAELIIGAAVPAQPVESVAGYRLHFGRRR